MTERAVALLGSRSLVILWSWVIGRWSFLSGSAEKACHWLGLHEFPRLVEMVQDDGVRVDAQSMVNSCQELCRVHRVFGGRGGGRIALAVEGSAADAGAGHECGVAIGPVITAVRRVAIARGADPEAG